MNGQLFQQSQRTLPVSVSNIKISREKTLPPKETVSYRKGGRIVPGSETTVKDQLLRSPGDVRGGESITFETLEPLPPSDDLPYRLYCEGLVIEVEVMSSEGEDPQTHHGVVMRPAMLAPAVAEGSRLAGE